MTDICYLATPLGTAKSERGANMKKSYQFIEGIFHKRNVLCMLESEYFLRVTQLHF